MEISNPFAIIAEINTRYYKIIAPLVFISFIVLLPFTIQGFSGMEGETEEFLQGNQFESYRANKLLDEKFPDRSDANIVVVLEALEDIGNFTFNNEGVISFLMNLTNELESDPEFNESISTTSLASIEVGVKDSYQEVLKQVNNSLINIFPSIINDTYSNIALLEEFLYNASELAPSIENFDLLPTVYMSVWYDTIRALYYLYNQTISYQSTLTLEDYYTISRVCNNTGAVPINNFTILQTYLSSFDMISDLIANPDLADNFTSEITFVQLNQSFSKLYKNANLDQSGISYTNSALYSILLLLQNQWENEIQRETNEGQIPIFRRLVGGPRNPNETEITPMRISQLVVLIDLFDIKNQVLEATFRNISIASIESGVATDFETISSILSDNTSLSSLTPSNELLGMLHLLPNIYMSLWSDFARSSFYLYNLTPAYTSFFSYQDYLTVENIWYNITGPGEFSKQKALQAYVATYDVIDSIMTNGTVADSFFNQLVFNTLNMTFKGIHNATNATEQYKNSFLYQMKSILVSSLSNRICN
ncbi:MAG: hypothetical protein ACXAC7_01690 [Candidatus Hodarchaeales archaeon]|jgi:hypothetical protein